jgi:DNA uptake protein ComE-like DNA-binding protein
MNFKQLIQDYFTFSRNERKGITVLLVIIFLLAVANKIIFYFETPATIDTNLLNAPVQANYLAHDSVIRQVDQHKLFAFNPNTIDPEALDSLSLPDRIKRNMLRFREKGGRYYSENDFRKTYGVTDSIFRLIEPFLLFEKQKAQSEKEIYIETELFEFDPNTSTDQEFARLGLSEKQIHTIRNYQSKGGSFKKKADFLKIYGITPVQQNTLLPYILIAGKEKVERDKKAEINFVKIEINGPDTVELMRLPGIGNKLLKRIVKYRDLLGGYYCVEQLKEVYGMSEHDFQQIGPLVKIDTVKIHKVDLNFADWNELAKHPYIQKNTARQIIRFRTKYGRIDQPSVLRDSALIGPKEYLRLKPYL